MPPVFECNIHEGLSNEGTIKNSRILSNKFDFIVDQTPHLILWNHQKFIKCPHLETARNNKISQISRGERLMIFPGSKQWFLYQDTDYSGLTKYQDLALSFLDLIEVKIIKTPSGIFKVQIEGEGGTKSFNLTEQQEEGEKDNHSLGFYHFYHTYPNSEPHFVDTSGENVEDYEEALKWIEDCTGLGVKNFYIEFNPNWGGKELTPDSDTIVIRDQGELQMYMELE